MLEREQCGDMLQLLWVVWYELPCAGSAVARGQWLRDSSSRRVANCRVLWRRDVHCQRELHGTLRWVKVNEK
jgi:hypothetical protein